VTAMSKEEPGQAFWKLWNGTRGEDKHSSQEAHS